MIFHFFNKENWEDLIRFAEHCEYRRKYRGEHICPIRRNDNDKIEVIIKPK